MTSDRFEPMDVVSGVVLESGERWAERATRVQVEDAAAIVAGEPPFAFVTRSRGFSKTTDAAAVMLELLLTLPERSRCFWAAADAEQGGLALDAVGGFLARTPFLRGLVELQARRVVCLSTGSSLDVLPADSSSAWGLKPAAVVIDEFSAWPEASNAKRLWEALSSAVLKVEGARLIVITTAGNPTHFSYQVLEHARSSPLWRVSETEGPPPWAPADRLAEQRARLPEAVYAQLWENRWTEAAGSFFASDAIDRCFDLDGPALRPVEGLRYFAGLDLGHVQDASVFALGHLEGQDVYLDALMRWQGSRTRPVSFQEVEEAVAGACKRFRATLWADPWQAKHVLERLDTRGVSAREFSFGTASKQRLSATMLQLVNDGALHLFEAEGLRAELVALRVKQSAAGTWTFDHTSGRHDDMTTAIALVAVAALSTQPGTLDIRPYAIFPGETLYETERGDLLLTSDDPWRYNDRPSSPIY